MFPAGAGITSGAVDEFRLLAVESRVHIRDLHATTLHPLSLGHFRLTFPRNGHDETLTVNLGRVINEG